MKTLRFFLLSTLIVVLFSSCKKDPNEQVAKSWKVTSYKVDGQERLNTSVTNSQQTIYSPNCNQDFTYSSSYKIKSITMDIKEGGNFTSTEIVDFTNLDFAATDSNCVVTMETTTSTFSSSGTWSVSSDGKQITLVYNESGITQTIIYDITELKRKTMKWKRTESGSTEEYSFAI